MEPFRPMRDNCGAQFGSWYLSCPEARVANYQAQPLKAEQGGGKSKRWIPLANSDLCGLCAQPQRTSKTKLVDGRRRL